MFKNVPLMLRGKGQCWTVKGLTEKNITIYIYIWCTNGLTVERQLILFYVLFYFSLVQKKMYTHLDLPRISH